MVGFPNMSGSSRFHDVLKRQVLAFELATCSTLKLNMKISATSTQRKGGYIHCSSNEGNVRALVGNRVTSLSLTSAESKVDT